MNITKRQPVSVGEMITEEFLVPMALTQGQPPCNYGGHCADAGYCIWEYR
jgi:hypothetical protein